MTKVTTLRNILALCSLFSFLSCKNESDDPIYGQWSVQAMSSESEFIPNMENKNYSLNINQLSPDGSTVEVSNTNGVVEDAAVKYKSGDNMIVEFHDQQTGEKVLMQMKKN